MDFRYFASSFPFESQAFASVDGVVQAAEICRSTRTSRPTATSGCRSKTPTQHRELRSDA